MTEMIKVCALGICGVMLAELFRGHGNMYEMLIGTAVCILLIGYGFGWMRAAIESIELLQSYLDGNMPYLKIILKVIGISYVCEFGAGICLDAGKVAIAKQIETLGKVSILLSGMPILLTLLKQIQDIL